MSRRIASVSLVPAPTFQTVPSDVEQPTLRVSVPDEIGFAGSQAITSSWVNYTPQFDDIMAALGADVQPGAAVTYSFGLIPYTGTAGGHPTYGWRHACRLLNGNEAQINQNMRAAIANECARRYGYVGAGALYRGSGVDFGGRPIAISDTQGLMYFPEFPGDTIPIGWLPFYPGYPTTYPPGATIRADGLPWNSPDLEHSWDILWEVVIKSGTRTAPVPSWFGVTGNIFSIGILAGWRLWMRAEMTAGQIRKPYELNWADKLNQNKGSDRAWGIPLLVLLRAAYLGCTNTIAGTAGGTDIDGAAIAYLDAALEFYLHQPGVSIHTSPTETLNVPSIAANKQYFLPVQLAQVLVAFWEWRLGLLWIDPAGLQHGTRVTKLTTAIIRIAQWVTECALACLAPNAGQQPWRVSITNDALGPVNGLSSSSPPGTTIPASIAGVAGFTPHFDSSTHPDSWMYYPLRIAASLGQAYSASAATKAATILTANQANSAEWPWLIGVDGLYAVAAAAAICGEATSTG